MIYPLLFWAFIALSLLHLAYWLFPFGKLASYQANPFKKANNFPPVSLIICAKNEQDKLARFLPVLLKQDYPVFELLVVNDGSNDGTGEWLDSLSKKHPNLRVLTILPEEKGNRVGKKYPLSKGIEASQYETLLLTDADCIPVSNEWIQKMVLAMDAEKSIVLGFSPYQKKKGWLNKFIRFEAIYTAMQYLGFALVGEAYMGVGRNILYQKKHFRKVGGFLKHEHIASGDDDLLVNEIANKKNTAICLAKASFMESEPKMTWKDYYRQKTRHLTTGVHYKFKHQILLGGLSLSHFGFYVLGFLLISLVYRWELVLFLMLVISMFKAFLYYFILEKLSDKGLFFYVLFLDALFVFYYLIFIPDLFLGRTNKWK